MSIPRGPLSEADHLELLKQAIDANLRARIEYETRLHEATRDNPPQIKIFTLAELRNADPHWMYLDEVVEDPPRKALRAQLKDLGQRLYDLLGDTDDMVNVADDVANLDPDRFYTRIDLIEKNWDGVGNGDDIWVA